MPRIVPSMHLVRKCVSCTRRLSRSFDVKFIHGKKHTHFMREFRRNSSAFTHNDVGGSST